MKPVLGVPIRHGDSGVHGRLGKASRFASWDGARLLDLGCGNGAYTLEMAKTAQHVIGLDVEPERLDEFNQRIDRASNIRICRAAGEYLPLRPDEFDVVFCIETLEHVSDEAATLSEIRRVLRPGGQLLMTIPNKWYIFETHGLRPSWLKGSNRYPFASWLPAAIHRRVSNARIYRVGDIERLLRAAAFMDVKIDWMLPPLDKVEPPLVRKMLRKVIGRFDETPLRRLGVSLVVCATKPPSAGAKRPFTLAA